MIMIMILIMIVIIMIIANCGITSDVIKCDD